MTKRANLSGIYLAALAASLGLATTGCGGGDDDNNGTATPTHIEVAGSWGNTDFGEDDTIDDTTWAQTFGAAIDDPMTITSTITKFDNKKNLVIVADENGKFGRWVWTEIDGDSFYYCMEVFGAASAEDAESSTEMADDSDPETSGCGGFSWTKLTKQ